MSQTLLSITWIHAGLHVSFQSPNHLAVHTMQTSRWLSSDATLLVSLRTQFPDYTWENLTPLFNSYLPIERWRSSDGLKKKWKTLKHSLYLPFNPTYLNPSADFLVLYPLKWNQDSLWRIRSRYVLTTLSSDILVNFRPHLTSQTRSWIT